MALKASVSNQRDLDRFVDYQIKKKDNDVDENLRRLQERYGKEYLQGLSDKEFY